MGLPPLEFGRFETAPTVTDKPLAEITIEISHATPDGLRNDRPAVVIPHSPGQRTQQLSKALPVIPHRHVVEHAVARLPAVRERVEALQFLGRMAVARAGCAVESEIADSADGDWFGLERVEHGDQIEVPAQRRDERCIPVPTGFPAHVKLAAFGVLEKATQARGVLFRWAKTLRALKEHEHCAEGFGHRDGFVPGPANRRVEPEMATVFAVARVQAGATVGGTGRTMGDDLPGFQREFKIGRRRGPPARRGLDLRQLVKARIDFYARKGVEVFLLRHRETATTDPHIRTPG